MSFESFVSKIGDIMTNIENNGESKKFDPDRRIDINENQVSFSENVKGFDPDQRIDVNVNEGMVSDGVTKFDPDQRVETYKNKPPHSPDVKKWIESGGDIQIEEKDGKHIWTYIDSDDRKVEYVDGYPVFPDEAKHPLIADINIGKFTGDKYQDKKLYLEKLENLYGLTQIPSGYELHHDSENGNMQLIKSDWHKEFTHIGGYSLYKEV